MSPLPQGDLGLLDTAQAQRLLTSTVPARMAFVAVDGTPRVVPTHFVWDGREIVSATFDGALRVPALRRRPEVALTIDTEGFPPVILQIRGSVELTDVEGMVPEYAQAMRRYVGAEAAAAVLAETDRPGLRMTRIAVRPHWVGLLDFADRMPAALGGVGR